jgi:hypothetical protein
MTTPPKTTMGALLKAAYIEGWRRSLEGYSIWKNGEQLTAMGRRARDEMAKAEEVAGPEFEIWLAKQKEAYGKES